MASATENPALADQAKMQDERHSNESSMRDLEKKPQMLSGGAKQIFRPRIIAMACIVSMGGFIFGYDTGQISGFLEMPDFLDKFADQQNADGGPAFSNVRSGLIVALLSIGTLVGALIAAPISDKFGRKYSIIFWNIIFCVGVIVQITTTTKWVQVALGRWVAGLGVGGLSVLTPMYQSETAPRYVRGALVSCYQLFITLGIFTAYCINFGTEADNGSRAWKLPMGIGFIWSGLMVLGIIFLQESPRWEYSKGKIAEARKTIALTYGVNEDHAEVQREIREIEMKMEAERAGGGEHHWYEVFTAPRMAYRTLLGMTLQMLQQLTGANYFFYYGTTVFASVGLSNPYVTSIILGAVNFGCTFPGLYIVEKYGRRPALIYGALWMFCMFIIFASLGHFALGPEGNQSQSVGYGMIIVACLFIAAFASTWGPLVWAVVSELYPTRYRAQAIALSTSSNWIWNFLLSFFTPFITHDIDYLYGFVFAGCCFAGAVVVYFFVCESQGRSLEEIDTMYILGVKPWNSKDWVPPEGEELPNLDNTYLTPGGRGINKKREARVPEQAMMERVPESEMQSSGAAAPANVRAEVQ